MSLILAYIFTLWSCWSKPLADSGAVQPRNQIKNQREDSWRTTFPENPALCHGCAGLLVFLSVSFTCLGISHHPKNRKKAETDNLLRTKRWSSHQNMIHRLHNNDKNLFAEKLLQGDSWTSALPKDEINAKKSGLSSYSFTRRMSRFQKTSSASLSSVVAPPDHWIKIPSGLHAVAVLMRHVRYGQRTSPSCTCQRKQGKNHNGTTHRSVAHRTVGGITHGSLVPMGQSANDLNKLQRYGGMVNAAKFEFHPNITQRHVLQTTFFSDQRSSWHCLQYICRVASVA